jgi:hypothetical protein
VATTPCLAEGLNIPEASVVVFLDYDWVPSVMAQAFSRVRLRRRSGTCTCTS